MKGNPSSVIPDSHEASSTTFCIPAVVDTSLVLRVESAGVCKEADLQAARTMQRRQGGRRMQADSRHVSARARRESSTDFETMKKPVNPAMEKVELSNAEQ